MPQSVLFVRDSVNHKNKVLEVDGSNQLSVKDAIAQSSLTNIDSKCSNISADQATATNQSTANGSLATIATASGSQATAANQATANSSLGTLATASADQATAAHQLTVQGKLDTINTTLGGTLTVSSSSPARSSGSIASAASKSAGDLSSSVDGNAHRKCAIFGSCSSNSGSVKIHISHDNANFYEDNTAQYYANFSNGHIAGHFEVNARYFKVEFMDTATYTLEYAMID